jgi:hypothetical protein
VEEVSEGEFKKRILSMDIGEEDAVRVAVILEVLVEAKKEFPIYGNVEIELLKKRQIIQVRDAQEAFVHAIYDWFEKWFGEKE